MDEVAKDIEQNGEVKLPDNCVAEPNAGIGKKISDMTDHEKLECLLKLATQYEDQYYDFAAKCMESNNMVGNMVNAAQASAFQRMRYTLEDMLNPNS
jgi:hypothetical protein